MEKTEIKKPTIQNRIEKRVTEILEPVEVWLDRHAFTPERFNPNTMKLVDLFKREKVGGIHARKIQERYQATYTEYKTLLDLRENKVTFEELDDDMKQAIIRLVNYLAIHKHGEDEMIVPMLKQIDCLLNPKQTLN